MVINTTIYNLNINLKKSRRKIISLITVVVANRNKSDNMSFFFTVYKVQKKGSGFLNLGPLLYRLFDNIPSADLWNYHNLTPK